MSAPLSVVCWARKSHGFTLVELALVLVIIGLIIGGILVGQDMIKSAEVRATIGQWESFNAAQTVFRDKYNALPGDIKQQAAINFGFYDRSSVAEPGNGDGDGILEFCGANLGGSANILRHQSCERTLFWRDLSTAQLVGDGLFVTATNTAAAITTEELVLYFPVAEIGNGNYWLVSYGAGRNYFFLGGITSSAGTGIITSSASLSPVQAFSIDRKVDDGMPLRGQVRPYNPVGPTLLSPTSAAAPMAGVCISNVDESYNQSTEVYATTPACHFLRMNMQ